VIEDADPARGDDRDRHGVHHQPRELELVPLAGAVPVHAGQEDLTGPEPAWDVYVAGGRTRVADRDAVSWAVEAAERGAGEILLTSMDRDGTEDGYDLELTAAVTAAVPIPVIASGGVGTLDHLAAGILAGGADAVLAASIFHYGRYSIAEAKRAMREAGIDVR
jgi:cyclase